MTEEGEKKDVFEQMDYWRTEARRFFGLVPKTHNCAQAVVEIAGRAESVPPMAAHGGGRAPNGYCGALYGALAVTPEERHEAVKEEFAQRAGALTCKEIKGGSKTPCEDCVAIASALAMKYRS